MTILSFLSLLMAALPSSVVYLDFPTLWFADPASIGIGTALAIAGGAKVLDALFGVAGQSMAAQQSAKLTQLSADLSQRNWQQQFDVTNQYNLPVAQVDRLMAAGINPFVSNSTASPVTSAAGSLGVGSPSAPSVSGYDFGGQSSSQIDAANRLLQNPDISPTVKRNVEADTRNKTSGARLSSSNANKTDIESRILELCGEDNAKLANEFLRNDIRKIQSLIDLNDMHGLEAFENSLRARAAAALDANKANMFVEQTMAYIEQLKADAQYKRESAVLAGEQAREQRVSSNIAVDTEEQVKQQILQEAISRANAARVAGDNAELTFWTDYVSSVLTTGAEAFETVKGGLAKGSYKGLTKAKINDLSQRIDLDKAKFEHQRNVDSQVDETVTDTRNYYDAKGRKHTQTWTGKRKRPSH